jgi:hypothetical protein
MNNFTLTQQLFAEYKSQLKRGFVPQDASQKAHDFVEHGLLSLALGRRLDDDREIEEINHEENLLTESYTDVVWFWLEGKKPSPKTLIYSDATGVLQDEVDDLYEKLESQFGENKEFLKWVHSKIKAGGLPAVLLRKVW